MRLAAPEEFAGAETEKSELERLRRANAQLRMDNEFLGKAAAFFVDPCPGHHRHGGRHSREWVEDILDEEFARPERFDGDRFADACDIFEEVTLNAKLPVFLSLPAYDRFLHEAREKATDEELATA